MDIGSGSGYPSSNLSNFSPHAFVIDGIECASMEGFLQSLKFQDPEMQKHICTLVGKAAKFKGKKKKWWKTQTLYWQGEAIPRDSERYQELLDKAFNALSENSSFKRALLATQNATLTHNIGKKKTSETVLTKNEFTSRLTAIRSRLQKKIKPKNIKKNLLTSKSPYDIIIKNSGFRTSFFRPLFPEFFLFDKFSIIC